MEAASPRDGLSSEDKGCSWPAPVPWPSRMEACCALEQGLEESRRGHRPSRPPSPGSPGWIFPVIALDCSAPMAYPSGDLDLAVLPTAPQASRGQTVRSGTIRTTHIEAGVTQRTVSVWSLELTVGVQSRAPSHENSRRLGGHVLWAVAFGTGVTYPRSPTCKSGRWVSWLHDSMVSPTISGDR